MATANQAPPTPTPPLEQLRPTFEARRFVAPSAGFDADSPRTVPSPAEGGWRWIGEPETLAEYGAQPGQRAEPNAYERVERGQHPETYSRVRKANTVERHLDDPERAAAAKGGKESTHVHGLVHLSGSYGAPAAMEQTWRQGGAEDRATIEHWLTEETRAGIARISKTDRVAAAAVVRDDGEAGLRVDWVAVGADRGKGIETPYERRGITAADAFAAERADHLRSRIEREQREREQRAVAPPAAEIPTPRSPRTELPSRPLRDSLGASAQALGSAAALDIKGRADHVAKAQRLDQLSEQELRKRLPRSSPFEKLPAGGDQEKLKLWWRDHGVDAVHAAAVEGTLIDRARAGYRELAERECARRDAGSPDPMKAVRAVRGAEFADKVERRAAVLASNLGSLSEQQRGERTAALRQEIQATGLDKARFSALAESVALQHGRNAANELQAARDRAKGVTQERGTEVEAGIGVA